MENKEKIVEGLDKDGNEVKVLLRQPTPQDYRDSQIEYNKAFNYALKSKAPLRQKLVSVMRDNDVWDDEKQKKHDQLISEISSQEDKLKGGGIKLSEAREIALLLREKREEFRELLSEKNALDQNSAEGQADNARFAELIRLCMLDPKSKKPCFMDQKAYDSQAEQPWVIKAASELAGIIYGLDPDYDKNLEENKFLKEFNFVNEELDFINEEGHTVDSEGRLINEEGRYIAYRTEKAKEEKDQSEVYFVNRDGEEVICKTNEKGEEEWVKISLAERKPFLDDDGSPIGVTSEKKTKATKKPKRSTKKQEEAT